MTNGLLTSLARMRRRLRLFDGWRLAQRLLPIALLAGALILLAGRLWPLANFRLWAGAPLLLWLAGVPLYSLLRPLSSMQVAQRVDRDLGLKERLSSSLSLTGLTEPRLPEALLASFVPELVERQRVDALAAAAHLQPARAYPLRWLKRPLQAAGGLLLICGLLVFLPNPMDRIVAERAAVAQAAKEQAKAVEEIKKQVQEAAALTPEEREELARRLEELANALRENPGDREKALADLAKAEEALRQRLQPNAAARQAALEAMAARLQQMTGSQRASEDLSGAAEDLQKLAEQTGALSEEQRQSLAQQLSQLAAQAGQSGESALAQALAEMAMAVRSGDPNAAKSAAGQARAAMQNAQRAQSAQQALQRALSQLQSGRQAVARAGQSGQQAGNQPGQGQNPGAGQNPGQGTGQGSSPGSGGGSNANQLPPNQGGKVQINPPRGNKPATTGQDLTGGQVYAPQTGSNGKEIFIPGQDTGQGTTEEQQSQNPLPGAPNPALVPYTKVLQQYIDSANQALDESYIPSGIKEYIKAYFEGLSQ